MRSWLLLLALAACGGEGPAVTPVDASESPAAVPEASCITVGRPWAEEQEVCDAYAQPDPPPPEMQPGIPVDPGTDPNYWGSPLGCTHPPCPGTAAR